MKINSKIINKAFFKIFIDLQPVYIMLSKTIKKKNIEYLKFASSIQDAVGLYIGNEDISISTVTEYIPPS